MSMKKVLMTFICLGTLSVSLAQTIPATYNDHKRGAKRMLQYRPDGDDFVSVNGTNRYTRALYGNHSPFRLETSDRPVFATYDKKNSRNISFRIVMNGSELPLDSTAYCEARYTAGRRSYRLSDPAWGKGQIYISALALPDEEGAVWRIESSDMVGATLHGFLSSIRAKRLSRNGDMGADPADSFEAGDSLLQRCTLKLQSKEQYLLFTALTLQRPSLTEGRKRYNEAEATRSSLASRMKIETPDAYFNTLGGALSVAADAIWDGEVWLHGAIGWRMPLSGWRAAYTGDVLGWHDRARSHFDAYAASQVTEVPCTIPHPAQDTLLNLARSVKQWGTPQYSNGYICRNPRRNDQMHHYDMNLCYIDELLWHFNWTGDLDYARQMWPVLVRHLAWEKRNYDPDNDGLYDAYACIWASDALYYNSGAVTHSSAYNYRANRQAALIASLIGCDAAPYHIEANKILHALNSRLWIASKGHWAEYQDFMGKKRLHESAAAWTIYHALDSEVGDPFQAYQATRYIDTELPHIPIHAAGLDEKDAYATIATTNWLPYAWSINNVAFAEVMHTALAYFQAGRSDEGTQLLKSSILDGMYLGGSPGNFGQVSFYDAARGECYRDFGDPIGVASRVLVQGLFGLLPDALQHRLVIRPGFPQTWDKAALTTPDISYRFQRKGEKDSYLITQRFDTPHTLSLQLNARKEKIKFVLVNGYPVRWTRVEAASGLPVIAIEVAPVSKALIEVHWTGANLIRIESPSAKVYADESFVLNIPEGVKLCSLHDPQQVLRQTILSPRRLTGQVVGVPGARTLFVRLSQAEMEWWQPIHVEIASPSLNMARPFASVTPSCETVEMTSTFNAFVTDLFCNEYLTPRSPYTTLQLPKQGIGEWCHPTTTAVVDDSGLRSCIRNGKIDTPLGVSFCSPAMGRNVAFTSLWDNYPERISVPLTGKASHVYLLMVGTTNHMQCHLPNGVIRVHYIDGSVDSLELTPPDNWCPIEQDFFVDNYAFKLGTPRPYRLHLLTGKVSNDLEKDLNIQGVYGRSIEGGAGVLLDMPIHATRQLSHLTLETLSNDVVIGLMGITLQRD